jgi:hypothetical protein
VRKFRRTQTRTALRVVCTVSTQRVAHVPFAKIVQMKPAHRAMPTGVGTALIRAVARAALDADCARFQWQVIDFNTAGLEFYKRCAHLEGTDPFFLSPS